jgi:DNA topoisomerase-2
MKSQKDLSKQYQKKSDKQHVLDNPDTYIGSIEQVDTIQYIYNDEDNKINLKDINLIPGLYKLFDEGIVNCRDHYVRMKKDENLNQVSSISVDIKDNIITLTNDGEGIDVVEHPEYKIWIPELIFGHLRTSTNYDKSEKKITGGKNGFGFKLVLIWSTWGKIETIDSNRGLKYIQEFTNNLDEIKKPIITKCKLKSYTKVSFKPDYKRLGIEGLSEDMIALFKRRVCDIAAVTDESVKIKYNNKQIPIKNFEQYLNLYIGTKSNCSRIYEKANDRWEYAVCLTPNDEFVQVSFVNGINTSKGGKHVEYILNQIVKKLVDYIKEKKKIEVKPMTIKEQLMLFIRCDIENPSFDSQTKDFMNTPISNFGSTCKVSDKFIENVAKLGVMNTACSLTEIKDNKQAKKTDGTKVKNLRHITKLVDANYAGTEKSNKCTIIFCEGDSAKAGIISGLSKEDREYIGVYPMKGKLFNVRGETITKISENKEIYEIKQILGLEIGLEYTRELIDKKLRYGKIIFMTDQDLDGSHIKGLGINLFDAQWPSLIKIENFIGFMNTPILKARKKDKELLFYNDGEYIKWKDENDNKGWKIKYYKGLGTSTAKEFKEYFQHKKEVMFTKTEAIEDNDDLIDMIFNKKRSNDRKDWLGKYDRNNYLDTNSNSVTYRDFINKELIHFSKYDCDRSIPSLMDGLKISLRKILYAAFKRNLKDEIKVAQLSGYVSENSGYHHGEASLNGAIINMAQTYVGSNNINLLHPSGQFGTRLHGGKDSASERYIFTLLEKLTRDIFKIEDDNILNYLEDDGQKVEPLYYAPIIPMILVNGTKGIGTGFSTDIMPYNPIEIIEYLENKINNKECKNLDPYFEGFTGKIIKIDKNKFLIKGNYTITKNIVHITELPIGIWTQDYIDYLATLLDNKKKTDKKTNQINYISDFKDLSNDTLVDIQIHFYPNKIQELLSQTIDENTNGLEKLLKLYNFHTTTNMHLFDFNDKLKKYNSIQEIIEDYYIKRLELYNIRKTQQLDILKLELKILSNKAKFIQETLNDTIDLRKKKEEEINLLLSNKKYDKIDDKYDYLTKLPMDSVSSEKVSKLLKDKELKEKEVNILSNKSIENIWLEDLNHLKENYVKYKEYRIELQNGNNKDKITKSKLKLKLNK